MQLFSKQKLIIEDATCGATHSGWPAIFIKIFKNNLREHFKNQKKDILKFWQAEFNGIFVKPEREIF